jgi:hypothetical protein
MCVCSLSYPARNAHAPYCIAICGLSGPALPYFFHITPQRVQFSLKQVRNNVTPLLTQMVQEINLRQTRFDMMKRQSVKKSAKLQLGSSNELICLDAEGGMTYVMNDFIV